MVKNVLITGSQGYIGTNLSDYIEKNSEINIYYADKSTGTSVEFLDSLQNIGSKKAVSSLKSIK